MKTGIIGFGFVGRALASVITEDYNILDPAATEDTLSQAAFDRANHDIIFICVPTPTRDGKCDDSIVLHYVEHYRNYTGLLVIKSTIPPATVDAVMEIRPRTVVWPELLREAHAEYDMANPDVTVIGAHAGEDAIRVEEWIENCTVMNAFNICYYSPREASIFKYAVNSFLAVKVVFMHQLKLWVDHAGAGDRWESIAWALKADERIGRSHMQAPGEHGYGYAGSCFPKDVTALLSQVEQDGTSLPLLAAAHEQNKKLRDIS